MLEHGDGFELGVVVSCDTWAREGWRTELHLGGGKRLACSWGWNEDCF